MEERLQFQLRSDSFFLLLLVLNEANIVSRKIGNLCSIYDLWGNREITRYSRSRKLIRVASSRCKFLTRFWNKEISESFFKTIISSSSSSFYVNFRVNYAWRFMLINEYFLIHVFHALFIFDSFCLKYLRCSYLAR